MRDYYAFDGHGYDREKARAALVPLLENPNFGRAWIILDGDSPVGYAVLCFGYSLEWLGRDAFVDELYLIEAYRDRGWGRRTMAFLEHESRALGIPALHLGVGKGTQRALCLYESVGCVRHDSTFPTKGTAEDLSKPATGSKS